MKRRVMLGGLIAALSTFSTLSAFSTQAAEFKVFSNDIQEGAPMHKRHEFKGFGCSGENLSPQLSWQHLPAGTKSIAVTAYDPDAPTGSGWWHWLVVDIPATVTELPRGVNVASLKARGIRNDYSITEFGGACPPPGHGMHRYQFTVWALPMEKLEVGADPSAAVIGYMLNHQALAKATITATYHQ